MTSIPLYHAHAFSASRLGGGNPAAVALLAQPLDDATRQLIAADMNLAETAFVEPLGPAENGADPFATQDTFGLRWFTPTTEVPMCGHATLASAAVLFQERGNKSDAIRFQTLSGQLVVRRCRQDGGNTQASTLQLQMALPLAPPTDSLPPPLDQGLDTDSAKRFLRACVGDLQVIEAVYSGWNNLNYLVLRLPDTTTRQQLEAIVPDFAAMEAEAKQEHVHGVIVTCKGDDEKYDFLSRFFGPWMGIPEDPVTGSAHAVLCPYWSDKLQGKGSSSYGAFGPCKNDVPREQPHLRARQCSKRGGDLTGFVQPNIGNVLITGSAVVVLKGTLEF